MEDVTDTVFRTLVARRAVPHVFMSEFIYVPELFHKKRAFARHRALIDPIEKETLAGLAQPGARLVAQIWGNDPESYAPAIARLRAEGFEGIDLNMGCPADKVVRRGEGSGLIDRPALAAELLQAAREAAGPLPVSIKTRLGVKASKIEEWAGFLLEQNLPALTVHGRIAAQKSDGFADWNAIEFVRELRDQRGVSTRIVGNGDLFSTDDLDARFAQTGVDGLMVGRGIFRDLDIFDPRRPHTSFEEAPWAERREVLTWQVREFQRVWSGKKGYNGLKAFFKISTRGPEIYLDLRDKLFRTASADEALALISSWDPKFEV